MVETIQGLCFGAVDRAPAAAAMPAREENTTGRAEARKQQPTKSRRESRFDLFSKDSSSCQKPPISARGGWGVVRGSRSVPLNHPDPSLTKEGNRPGAAGGPGHRPISNLEIQLECELCLTRRSGAENRARNPGAGLNVGNRKAKSRSISEIEELCAELQTQILTNHELLGQ